MIIVTELSFVTYKQFSSFPRGLSYNWKSSPRERKIQHKSMLVVVFVVVMFKYAITKDSVCHPDRIVS